MFQKRTWSRQGEFKTTSQENDTYMEVHGDGRPTKGKGESTPRGLREKPHLRFSHLPALALPGPQILAKFIGGKQEVNEDKDGDCWRVLGVCILSCPSSASPQPGPAAPQA